MEETVDLNERQDSPRIASEHEDNVTDYSVENSSNCDDQRSAVIMGALVKMQRGRNLLEQAAQKLEVLIEMPELPTQNLTSSGSVKFDSAGSSDKSIRDEIMQAYQKPMGSTISTSSTRSKRRVRSPARVAQGTLQKVEERSEYKVDAQGTSSLSSRAFGSDRTEDIDQEMPSRNLSQPSTRPSAPYASKQTSSFFWSDRPSLQTSDSATELWREYIAKFLDRIAVQLVSVSLILFTFVLICFDTDARANGFSADAWVDVGIFLCFLVYVIEFFAGIFSQGVDSVLSSWNYVDGFVVATGIIDYIIAFAQVPGFTTLRLLRLCRLLRIGRLIRALRSLHTVRSLKEQYLLVMMMASCVRTVFWAFVFTSGLMTIWSILAVEFLNDIVVRLDTTTSIWKDCDRCGRSFSSIWESNLTFMQTILAGDSWGLIALPVITDSWWTVFLFVGALATILFGVLNMISAVVIDTFAERRAKDIAHVAKELEYEERDEKKQLARMFEQIDADKSGALSEDELHEGARRVKEFRQYLRVLDIDCNELVDLFRLLDVDRSGEVDPNEFIDALYRMKTAESRTATRFLKYMVDGLIDRTKGLDERLDKIQSRVTRKLDEVERKIRLEIEEKPNDGDLQDILEDHADEINSTVARGIEKAVSLALEEGVSSIASKASHAIQEVVSSSSLRVAAMNRRLSKSGHDAASMSMEFASSFQKSQPPRFEADFHEGDIGLSQRESLKRKQCFPKKQDVPPPPGDPIVISAASKTPPPTEWFD